MFVVQKVFIDFIFNPSSILIYKFLTLYLFEVIKKCLYEVIPQYKLHLTISKRFISKPKNGLKGNG